MSIVVQKFGGTSLSDGDKMRNVADAVIREKKLGMSASPLHASGHPHFWILVKASRETFPLGPERLRFLP